MKSCEVYFIIGRKQKSVRIGYNNSFGRLTTKQFTHGEDGFKNEGRTDASSCASDFQRKYFKYLPEVKGSNTFKLSEFEIITRFTDF